MPRKSIYSSNSVNIAAIQERAADFSAVEGNIAYFDREPSRLVAYVETGLVRSYAVLAVHISALAFKVGQKLQVGKQAFKFGSNDGYIKPERFDNIGLILSLGRQMFPDSRAMKLL